MLNATAPVRVLDTRPGKGGSGPMQPGQTLTVSVLGRGAVPLSGVAAVTGTITAVPTAPPGGTGGYFSVWASGRPRNPDASNVNFGATGNVANQFTSQVGPDGCVKIYDGVAVNANVLIDLNGWVARPDLIVTPAATHLDWANVADTNTAIEILNNTLRYLMTAWWDGPAQTLLTANLDQGVSNNDAVRRLSMAAFALAVALESGLYDYDNTGVNLSDATDRCKQLIARVASQHLASRVDGWGEGWQTAMWAGICGRAAWLVWPDVDGDATLTRQVTAMVETEAGWAARYPLKYYRNAAGTVINTIDGDSGAEEISWNCGALQIARVMFPNHPNRRIWDTELCRMSLASWARPVDVTNLTMVNGRRLSEWITGSNVNPDGTVTNHKRYASDYATSTYQNLDGIPLDLMSGQDPLEAQRWLLGPVYAAHSSVAFPAPPYAAPGGATYQGMTAGIYYPQGCDWGTGQKIPYALADAQALVYGYDTTGHAAQYLELHMQAQLAMQARHADGHTYADDLEYNYPGKEEHAALQAAQLVQALMVRDTHGTVGWSSSPV